jgi:hypothetical protein
MGDELDRKIDRINNQRKALYSQIPNFLPKKVIKEEKIKKLTDILKEISDVIKNLLSHELQLDQYQDLLLETEKIITEIETSQMLGSIENIKFDNIDSITRKLQELLNNLKSYQTPINESTPLLS